MLCLVYSAQVVTVTPVIGVSNSSAWAPSVNFEGGRVWQRIISLVH